MILDEAWEIAEHGPMPLFLTNTCLCRACLFGSPAFALQGRPRRR